MFECPRAPLPPSPSRGHLTPDARAPLPPAPPRSAQMVALSAERAPAAVDVAAGDAHSLVIDAAGGVWACGSGARGQLGAGAPPPARRLAPKRVRFELAGPGEPAAGA